MLAQAQVETECTGPWVRTCNYTEVSYLLPLHCKSTLLEAHFSQWDGLLGSVNSTTILLVGPCMLGRFWVSCWTNRGTLVLEAGGWTVGVITLSPLKNPQQRILKLCYKDHLLFLGWCNIQVEG